MWSVPGTSCLHHGSSCVNLRCPCRDFWSHTCHSSTCDRCVLPERKRMDHLILMFYLKVVPKIWSGVGPVIAQVTQDVLLPRKFFSVYLMFVVCKGPLVSGREIAFSTVVGAAQMLKVFVLPQTTHGHASKCTHITLLGFWHWSIVLFVNVHIQRFPLGTLVFTFIAIN